MNNQPIVAALLAEVYEHLLSRWGGINIIISAALVGTDINGTGLLEMVITHENVHHCKYCRYRITDSSVPRYKASVHHNAYMIPAQKLYRTQATVDTASLPHIRH